MRLSTKSRYGARLLMDLARHGENGPVQISEISKRQGVSVKYLEQVIRPLKKAGFVKSIRGPKGGHVMAVDPKDITLTQVVKLLETHSDLVPCTQDTHSCDMIETCVVRGAWKDALDAFYKALDQYTIAKLVHEGPELNAMGKCLD